MYKTTKLNLSKILLIIFTIVQIFLGNHFGFVKIAPKKTEKLLKLLCVAASIVVFVLILRVPIYKYPFQVFYFVTYGVEYVFYSTALWISKYTFYDFLLDFSEIDNLLMLGDKSLDGAVIMTLVSPVITCLVKMSFIFVYCSCNMISQYCRHFYFEYAISSIAMIAVDSLILILFRIMHMCYKRVDILNLKLLNNELGAADAIGIYKKIFDGLDKMKPVIDKMVRICVDVKNDNNK
jgi:hypothetical protein